MVIAMGSDEARRGEERIGFRRRGPGCTTRTPFVRGLWPPPLVDAPGAAGDELGADDFPACFEGFLDGGLVRLAGGGEAQPLGIEGFLVVDLDRLGLAGGDFVVREGEAGGGGLQPGKHQDEGVLKGIGPARIRAGELGEALGLLLAVGGLATQVLDHPTGGIGFGRQGGFVVFLGKEGGLQFGEGLGAGVVVGFQLFGQLANGGGELLGLDAQLPEGTGALQGASRAGGLGDSWGERSGGGCEN